MRLYKLKLKSLLDKIEPLVITQVTDLYRNVLTFKGEFIIMMVNRLQLTELPPPIQKSLTEPLFFK